MKKTYHVDGGLTSIDESQQRCRALWCAVLYSAVCDIAGRGFVLGTNRRTLGPVREFWRQTARTWVESENMDVGSFRWICGSLDLDYEAVRERLLSGRINLPEPHGRLEFV